MRKKHICPNCGAKLVLPSIADNLTCPQCNTQLLLRSGSKLILAKPSSSYLDEDKATHESELATQDDHSGSLELSESRQKKVTLLAHERMSLEKKYRQEGVFSGRLTIAIGVFFLGVLGIQIYFLGVNEFSVVGIFIGILAVLGGVSVIMWFRRVFHSDE